MGGSAAVRIRRFAGQKRHEKACCFTGDALRLLFDIRLHKRRIQDPINIFHVRRHVCVALGLD